MIASLPTRHDDTACALRFERVSTTFEALDRDAASAARALMSGGVAPGTRIAFLDQASPAYYHVLYGCARARTVFVPLNWRLQPAELARVVADSEAEILFIGEAYLDAADALRGACPRLRKLVDLSNSGAGDIDYRDWAALGMADRALPAPRADDDVVQLYTSGTTGDPKGVVLTNANYDAIVRQSAEAGWVDWTGNDKVLVCMPLFHVGGVNVGLIAAARGACAILSRRADTETILRHIVEDRVTILFLSPTSIGALVRAAEAQGADLGSVRQVCYGTAPISEATLAQASAAFDADFVQLYGLTETAGSITHLSPEDHRRGGARLRSCGKAYPGTRVRVLDPDGHALPPGGIGEVVVSGPTVMNGYWRRPAETAAAIREGWLHTGDVGSLDPEGFLTIKDRLKDIIISGGENVYPGEVENVLCAHPDVVEAAVVGVPNAYWGEAVHAAVVRRPGAALDAEGLLQFARERIAGYKLPKAVTFLPDLPKTPAGKILRRHLRAGLAAAVDG